MVRLTPLGSEFESVIAAVILFLAGGVMSFMFCFAVTHIYLCYKRRITRKRRRHERNESKDNNTYAILEDEYPQEVLVVKKAKKTIKESAAGDKPKHSPHTPHISSSSTESTSTN